MNLISNRKSSWLFILLAIMILTGGLLWAAVLRYSISTSSQVVINEVCSNNFSLIKDEGGLYSDYIELYNPSSAEVSLEGYYLSDDRKQLQKYALGDHKLPPQGYHVIWLDGADRIEEGVIGFRLASAGEEIYLSNAVTGEIIDVAEIPELSYDTSYGRIGDGNAEWGRMTATAGRSNQAARILPSQELGDPVFSAESGFYEEAFPLTISVPAGEVLYYSLDGSDPTPEHSRYQTALEITDATEQDNVYAIRSDLSPNRYYTPSFKVDKATVVRAVSYNEEKNICSKIVTKVYFIGYALKEEYQELPVMSIVTDPDNLFGMEQGIYGNGIKLEQYKSMGGLQDGELLEGFTDAEGNNHYLYMASNAFNTGKEWEREATVTYFDEEHNYGFTQNIGIRIAGVSTRSRIKKSFNLYGRSNYDETVVLPYEFFPDTSYSTIKLRNGGNNNDRLMFTDAFLEEQAIGRKVSVQRSRPCVVFLNGEYWGLYNIRERYSEEYISNYYGIGENNVWLIENGGARAGDRDAQSGYEFMMQLVADCDLTYDDVYAMIGDVIDVQSFIDFLCINLYINNTDVSFSKNMSLWRAAEADGSEYGDGRWRWMLYDLDASANINANSQPSDWMQSYELLQEPFVQSFMVNEDFRKQFCLTFMDIANTIYSYDTIREALPEWEEEYMEPMVKNHQRFINGEFKPEDYHGYVMEKDDFFRRRQPFALESLAQELGLSGSLETITVNNSLSEGGSVTVNTARLEDFEEWSGSYLNDYPITLKAEANEGYRFVGWRIGSDDSDTMSEEQIEVSIPSGGLIIWAVFERHGG